MSNVFSVDLIVYEETFEPHPNDKPRPVCPSLPHEGFHPTEKGHLLLGRLGIQGPFCILGDQSWGLQGACQLSTGWGLWARKRFCLHFITVAALLSSWQSELECQQKFFHDHVRLALYIGLVTVSFQVPVGLGWWAELQHSIQRWQLLHISGSNFQRNIKQTDVFDSNDGRTLY